MTCYYCGEERQLSATDGYRNVCERCAAAVKDGGIAVTYVMHPETEQLTPKVRFRSGRERFLDAPAET